MSRTTSLFPESFNTEARSDFVAMISSPDYHNRARLSYSRYEAILDFCRNPARKASTNEEDSLKGMAKRRYGVRDGKLFYTAKSQIGWLEVVLNHEVFDIITAIHLRGGHKGITKTFQEICERYYGIKRAEVERVLGHCRTCAESVVSKSQPSKLQAIICTRLWERVQVDLIDMSAQPDGEYKWICHMRDHFSKYSSATAIRTKSSEEVSEVVLQWIVHFGPPNILQCDNGKEFKGSLLLLLRNHGIKVINGRPRHPQSQGLIEQANGVLKTKIAAWKRDNASGSWKRALPEVILSMNIQRHSTTGKSPYQIVFKQKPAPLQTVFPQDRQAAKITDEDNSIPEYTTTDREQSEENDSENTNTNNLLADVQERSEKARRKMVNQRATGRRSHRFEVGQFVSVAIPSKDRQATDPRRLFCKIIRKPHPDRHQLQSQFGILNRHFPTKEIEPINQSISNTLPEFLKNKKITLREAARLTARHTTQQVQCECRKACDNEICNCIRHKQMCGVNCHRSKASGKSSCGNTNHISKSDEFSATDCNTDANTTIPIDPSLELHIVTPKTQPASCWQARKETDIHDTIILRSISSVYTSTSSKQNPLTEQQRLAERQEIDRRLLEIEQDDERLSAEQTALEAIIQRYDEEHDEILQYGRLKGLPKISWIRHQTQETNLQQRLESDSFRAKITTLIETYAHSEFYPSYKARLLQHTMKRSKSKQKENRVHTRAWSQIDEIPVGYYGAAHPSLAPLIFEDFGSNHKTTLRLAMNRAGDEENEHSHIITEVVGPSLILCMMKEDLAITDIVAREILWHPLAIKYGNLVLDGGVTIKRKYTSLTEE